MNRYYYDGPVMFFDTCVTDHWKGETMATSEKKAKSNLAYQFKKSTNKMAAAKVTLPGKIMIVE